MLLGTKKCYEEQKAAHGAKGHSFGVDGGGGGGRGVPPRLDYSKSPKAKAREARRDPLVYIYILLYITFHLKKNL